MYDSQVRRHALDRLTAGESLRQVSHTLGINRSTLREWRERNGAYADRLQCTCPRCSETPLATSAYAYLLGQYLGDGCISRMGRSWVLRIATCDAYPAIRA